MSPLRRSKPTFEEFVEEYKSHQPELDDSAKYLRKLLEEGLGRFREWRKDRGEKWGVQRTEVRLKDCKSLYEKINDDPVLKFEEAFIPGHVGDLIGARFVCYNLADVERLGAHFIQGSWDDWVGLHYRRRSSEEKYWLKEAHESGYRGWHFDVSWNAPIIGKQANRAEIQVRTLLQDVWATYSHDDAYRAHVQKVIKNAALFAQLKDMSSIFHTFDQIFDRLRVEFDAVQHSEPRPENEPSTLTKKELIAKLTHVKSVVTILDSDDLSEIELADSTKLIWLITPDFLPDRNNVKVANDVQEALGKGKRYIYFAPSSMEEYDLYKQKLLHAIAPDGPESHKDQVRIVPVPENENWLFADGVNTVFYFTEEKASDPPQAFRELLAGRRKEPASSWEPVPPDLAEKLVKHLKRIMDDLDKVRTFSEV